MLLHAEPYAHTQTQLCFVIFFSVSISFGIVYRPLQAQLIYFGVVVSLKQMHYHHVSEMTADQSKQNS